MGFKPHHVALSVRDIEKSIEFYRYFGFKKVFHTKADGYEIAHLLLDSFILELFSFRNYVYRESLPLWEDLRLKGFRHLALQVEDIHRALKDMVRDGIAGKDTKVNKGRSGILYFFIQDPDGNYIEIVQDNRDFNHFSV